FEYGILKQQNNLMYSKDMKIIVRLWDIRCGKQIQVFNGHTSTVCSVEYSPFVVKNSTGNSNVICSGSLDNTIRFWDIRSNKEELCIKISDDDEDGINYLKFVPFRKKVNNNKQKQNDDYCIHLYYCSVKSQICVWG
ncbi:WD-40 repeat-containing protein, partial [Reticulomyxa filosa]